MSGESKEVEFKDANTMSQIKALGRSGLKTIMIRDAAGRIAEVYEAPITAQLDDPSLHTIYKFEDGAGGTSRRIIALEERVVGWPSYETLGVGYGNDINNIP